MNKIHGVVTIVAFIFKLDGLHCQTFQCNTTNPCANHTIECEASDSSSVNNNNTCEIDCLTPRACEYATIDCAFSSNCIVNCNDWYACKDASVNGTMVSNVLSMYFFSPRSQDRSAIGLKLYCPSNGGIVNPYSSNKNCHIVCDMSKNSLSCQDINIYTVNGCMLSCEYLFLSICWLSIH